jgi:hypothetical protein
MVNKATEIKSIPIERTLAKGSFIKAVSAVVWKDLQAESAPVTFLTMLVFSLIISSSTALELDVARANR